MRYFLYSDEQISEKNRLLAKSHKSFKPGVVVVNNKREKFTQLSDKPTIERFADTKIVASGQLESFTYEMPENIIS